MMFVHDSEWPTFGQIIRAGIRMADISGVYATLLSAGSVRHQYNISRISRQDQLISEALP